MIAKTYTIYKTLEDVDRQLEDERVEHPEKVQLLKVNCRKMEVESKAHWDLGTKIGAWQ